MSTPTGSRVIARVLPETTPDGTLDTAHDRASARVSGRASGWLSRRGRHSTGAGASRMARAASSLMIGLLTALVVFAGFTGSPQAANAGLKDWAAKLVCGISEDTPGARADNGMEALYGGRAPNFKSGQEDALTAYEAYGLMGMYWSKYDQKTDDCMDNMIANMLAAEIFNLSNLITGVTVSTYTWATDGDLLDSFTEPMTCVVAGCEGGKGLKDTLFLTYLLPVIVLGAVWAAWNGLVKKKTMQTTQGIVWMLCATTFSLIFLAQPGLIAEKSNEVIGGITQNITNGVTGITSSTVTKDEPCYLPDGSKRRGNRIAACSMWKAMMFTPWVTGQFGTSAHEPIPGVEATIQGRKPVDDIRLAQLDAQTLEDADEDDAAKWEAVRDKVIDGDAKGVDPYLWQGELGQHRLTVALSSLVASLCLGALVVIISFATVVMSVGMIMLIIVAPIFLLAGIHPGVGRGIALKWLELLLGTMFKRVVLAAMLSILIGMYQVILAAPMPWLSQIALIMAMGVGVFVFRKPMLDTLNVVKLGGSSTGMEAGLNREVKQATGGAIGAVAGGIAGAQGGGMDAMVKGAVKGGIAGSRSTPLRAASVGHGAGRRVGARDAAADKKKTKQKTTASGTTRPGSNDAAEQELEQARAKDQQLSQHDPDFDEIVIGGPGAPAHTSGGGPVPRPGGGPAAPEANPTPWQTWEPVRSVTREEYEAMDPITRASFVSQGGVPPARPVPASSIPQFEEGQPTYQYPQGGGSAPQSVPRPVSTGAVPAPQPSGVPAAPAGPSGLPTSAGVPTAAPSTDNGGAAASRLPTAPPPVTGTDRREAAAPAPAPAPAPAAAPGAGAPNVSTRQPNVSTRQPNVSTRQPNVSTQQPNVSSPAPTVPDSQPGQGGRHSAPPRPQS